MPANETTYLKDLMQFTIESMGWCIAESERETTKIYETLNLLLEDMKRRSNMSSAALKTVIYLQQKIQEIRQSNHTTTIGTLMDILEQINTENTEFQELTNPIVEALQFQDRVRQYLENIGKIISLWLTRGEEMSSSSKDAEEMNLKIGTEFLKCTTSQEERDIIRSVFVNLPSEARSDDIIMFF